MKVKNSKYYKRLEDYDKRQEVIKNAHHNTKLNEKEKRLMHQEDIAKMIRDKDFFEAKKRKLLQLKQDQIDDGVEEYHQTGKKNKISIKA